MKRIFVLVSGASLAVLGLWWALGARDDPSGLQPSVIPMNETVTQELPGPDGTPEQWTLTKRRTTARPSVESELPAPAQRASAPDARTESARTLNGLALEAWKHGDISEAQRLFEDAIEQDPDDWVPRSEYGRLLVMLTRYADAAPQLERAAELNPEDPRAWLDLLSYYERTVQIERAVEARRRATQLAGSRAIEQDETGLWRLEGESIYP